MNIKEYINGDFLKYAIITREAYESDELAQAIASRPRSIGVDYIALSISKSKAQEFADYVENLGYQFEFEFIEGSGKVSLLNHAQAVELAFKYDVQEEVV